MINFLKSTLQMVLFSGAALLLVVGYLNYYGAPESKSTGNTISPSNCDSFVMYSASWCPACRSMRAKLKNKGIIFKEYLVDKDKAVNAIFRRKMKEEGRKIVYPTIEINGKIVGYFKVDYYQTKYNLCTL